MRLAIDRFGRIFSQERKQSQNWLITLSLCPYSNCMLQHTAAEQSNSKMNEKLLQLLLEFKVSAAYLAGGCDDAVKPQLISGRAPHIAAILTHVSARDGRSARAASRLTTALLARRHRENSRRASRRSERRRRVSAVCRRAGTGPLGKHGPSDAGSRAASGVSAACCSPAGAG